MGTTPEYLRGYTIATQLTLSEMEARLGAAIFGRQGPDAYENQLFRHGPRR